MSILFYLYLGLQECKKILESVAGPPAPDEQVGQFLPGDLAGPRPVRLLRQLHVWPLQERASGIDLVPRQQTDPDAALCSCW